MTELRLEGCNRAYAKKNVLIFTFSGNITDEEMQAIRSAVAEECTYITDYVRTEHQSPAEGE